MSTPLAPLSEDRENFARRMTSLGGAARLFPDIDAVLEECAADSVRLLAERDSLERERDEARAQIFAAHAERNEADRDLAVAQEQVRSLTVERDALVVSRDECFDRATREAKAADEARARLSRAREALDRHDDPSAEAETLTGTLTKRLAEVRARALAALRAALAEPLGGP